MLAKGRARSFSSKNGKEYVSRSTFSHNSIKIQGEIYASLLVLEIKSPETDPHLDLRMVREQYLKLAQRYHPDLTQVDITSELAIKNDEKFVAVKEAYDRLVELNTKSNFRLFIPKKVLKEQEILA